LDYKDKNQLSLIIMVTIKVLRAILFSALAATIISCSSDDDYEIVFFDKYPSIEETFHTDTINGWAITRDESERVEKLYNCPTSFDEVKHLFPLSEGNEIRLTDKDEQGINEVTGFMQYCEIYHQYYNGVPVQVSAIFYYNITPQGKRMTYALAGPFIDVKNLDTTPNISEDKARQIFADYLRMDKDNSWECTLSVREFSSRNGENIAHQQRLIYEVWGPLAPMEPNICYFRTPQYNAIIDAHTGELIFVGI
jgi:hypothetical protein